MNSTKLVANNKKTFKKYQNKFNQKLPVFKKIVEIINKMAFI